MNTFLNEAKPCDPAKHSWDGKASPGMYGFDKAPKYLFDWSCLFQAMVSQVGTYLLTGKFHDHECGIYKCEGGCKIVGVGDLVLSHDSCYWDYGPSDDKKNLKKMADLITALVLGFDPMEPIESLLDAAAKLIPVEKEEIRKALGASSCGGVFGGNSLSQFFRHNPFGKWKHDREYQRYIQTRFGGKTDKQVDQDFADEDLGDDLLNKLQEKVRASGSHSVPMCCSPSRKGNDLRFWVNTGTSTQIDGWMTQEKIEEYLKSDGKLVKAKDLNRW